MQYSISLGHTGCSVKESLLWGLTKFRCLNNIIIMHTRPESLLPPVYSSSVLTPILELVKIQWHSLNIFWIFNLSSSIRPIWHLLIIFLLLQFWLRVRKSVLFLLSVFTKHLAQIVFVKVGKVADVILRITAGFGSAAGSGETSHLVVIALLHAWSSHWWYITLFTWKRLLYKFFSFQWTLLKLFSPSLNIS